MATFIPDRTNEIFDIAVQLVNESARNIFLTGKAGTGKTSFLRYIRQTCPKEKAVVAPTGVAAINAGGVTMHSFFQLPLSPYIPVQGRAIENEATTNRHSLISRLRFNREKKRILQKLELLIIDEISMVRCDTLDAIDVILRHIRQRPAELFGGVQVLLIGDMLQLPPVIKDDEWAILKDYYESPYFFHSQAISSEAPLYIEFNKIYRQTDSLFIELLNQVRNNRLDEEGMRILESRYLPDFNRNTGDGYIVLTTHNERARSINAGELEKLGGSTYSFEAKVDGEFADRAFPAEQQLEMKIGAQVMFIRNDSSDRGKRYYNGKIGFIKRVEDDKIYVLDRNEEVEIEVQKEKWENIRYTLNKSSGKLEEDILGSFSQYPLRLAWAITIHKSQGLSFEKAIIDAGAAFAAGQVYVALSRCTNLEGLVLKSRINQHSLLNDERILKFSELQLSTSRLAEELVTSRKHYQRTHLLSCFDFLPVLAPSREIVECISKHKTSFLPGAAEFASALLEKITGLQEIGLKFQAQLNGLFNLDIIPEENQNLADRTRAASIFFGEESGKLISLLKESPVSTDSSLHAKEFNDNARHIFTELAWKKYLLAEAASLLDINCIRELRKKFVIPSFTVNAYSANNDKITASAHPELQRQLRKAREKICSAKNLPVYMVAGTDSINEMATYLPQTLEELLLVKGFGAVKCAEFGQQFIDIINSYANENGLSSTIQDSKKTKKPRKPKLQGNKMDTKSQSLALIKQGMNIQEIATHRKLARETIENHLSYYVANGDLEIEQLISQETLLLVEPILKKYNNLGIVSLKQKIGETLSYGELRMAMAWSSGKTNGSA